MNISNIKCAVFDADNTLYATKLAAKESDKAAMNVLADATQKKSADLYNEFMEIVKEIKNSFDPKVRHRKYSYGILLSKAGAKYDKDLLDKMCDAFKKTVIDKIEIVPGILDLLTKIKDKELYVVTEDNREMATAKLEKLGILDKFKSIITSDDAGIMKPSENYYGELLDKFKPEEIIVFGDDYRKDLELPEKLGMKTFLIDSPKAMQKIPKLLL